MFFAHQKESLGPRSNLVVRVGRDLISTRRELLLGYHNVMISTRAFSVTEPHGISHQ